MQSVMQKTTGLGPKPAQPGDLHGRVAIITGGARGIGFEISRALANAGCKVIMVNRNQDKGDHAIRIIKKESPDAEVEWRGCDMGYLAQVREVFGGLRENLPRLDFLVCSAGINADQFGLDQDGIDRHFGVNYLGHYYACNQLWPLLRKTGRENGNTAPPRVVFEASEMHRMAPSAVHFGSSEEINNPEMDPAQLYGRTKLALILLAKYGLRDKVIKPNNDRIYALSVHPGTVKTDMQEQWKSAYPGVTGKVLSRTMQAFGRAPKEGAYSALWALTSPKIEEKNLNGWYFKDPDSPGKESSQASDAVLGAALWHLSDRLVKEKLGEDAMLDWNAQ